MTHPDFENLQGRDAIRYYFLEQHFRCFDPDNAEFSSGGVDENELHAADIILAEYGFAADYELRTRTAKYAPATFAAWVTYTGAALRSVCGRYDDFLPLYRDFPRQIPRDATEEWIRRVLGRFQTPGQPCLHCGHEGEMRELTPCGHVICGNCFDMTQFGACPICQRHIDNALPAQKRPPSEKETGIVKRLTYGGADAGRIGDNAKNAADLHKNAKDDAEDDLYSAAKAEFRMLCNAARPLSDAQNAFLTECCRAWGAAVYAWLPEIITLRQTVARVFGALMRLTPADAWVAYAQKYLSSATDVLRMIAIFSGEKADLSKRFRRMSMPYALIGAGVFGDPERMLRVGGQSALNAYKSDPKADRYASRRYATAVFKSARMTRAERRCILALLSAYSEQALCDDMHRYRAVWTRIGETLHPSEYASRYPKAHRAFMVLRKKTAQGERAPKRMTFAGQVEDAVRRGRPDEAAALLKMRPGEFARQINRLMRLFWLAGDRPDPDVTALLLPAGGGDQATKEIQKAKTGDRTEENGILQFARNLAHAASAALNSLAKTSSDAEKCSADGAQSRKMAQTAERLASNAPQQAAFIELAAQTVVAAPTPTLLTLIRLLARRERPGSARFFEPNSRDGVRYFKTDGRAPLPQAATRPICRAAAIEVIERFARRKHFETCLIDEALKTAVMPRAAHKCRDASAHLALGSRVKIDPEPNDIVRLFLHWCQKDADCRVDLDLSAVFYDERFQKIGQCTYYELTCSGEDGIGRPYAEHSGDRQDAPPPDGASEFIDIDADSARKAGCRYVALTVMCYNNVTFDDLTEAYAGVMIRSDANAAVFDPRTVSRRFALSGQVRCFVPIAFDLVQNEIISVDAPMSRHASGNVNVVSESDELRSLLMHVVAYADAIPYPSRYEIACIHAAARCKNVIVRQEDGKIRVYRRKDEENSFDYWQRMMAQPPDFSFESLELAATPPVVPSMAFLLRGDALFAPGSETSIVFPEKSSGTVGWEQIYASEL